eukprot:8957678-Pyramimonas_sp.AAC.1
MVTLTTDSAYGFSPCHNKDLTKPTECTLLGHTSCMRQIMERGIAHSSQRSDTRDMTADGDTKGGIDRHMPLQVMGGTRSCKHD